MTAGWSGYRNAGSVHHLRRVAFLGQGQLTRTEYHQLAKTAPMIVRPHAESGWQVGVALRGQNFAIAPADRLAEHTKGLWDIR